MVGSEKDKAKSGEDAGQSAQITTDRFQYPVLKRKILKEYSGQQQLEVSNEATAENTCTDNAGCRTAGPAKLDYASYPVLKKRILSSFAEISGHFCSTVQPANANAPSSTEVAEPVVKKKKVITLEEYRRRRARANLKVPQIETGRVSKCTI